ncbi:AAA family ATPase [Iamia majanohamensis]|uniref:AAA family ATPase n=1 Tax=Iamia majanohamensis TaxID=467976 RepID=A0AAE9YE77_9ACTN|nr:ATP-binding protein [Iamia majanohamensis]WCO69243.1 AAA family ATPase [Iamia majanohamensis]
MQFPGAVLQGPHPQIGGGPCVVRLVELRIRNYRTIRAEQTLRIQHGSVVVGPNNSGKTNLLRAFMILFTGYKNQAGYKRDLDLSFGAGTQKSSFVATFDPTSNPHCDEIHGLLDELHAIVGTERSQPTFSISLYFTGEDNTPTYRVFSNQKITDQSQKANYSRKQKQLVELVLGQFRCHYVPSAKSVAALYDDLLNPFLTFIAAEVLEPEFAAVMSALAKVAESVNARFAGVGLEQLEARFALQGTVQDLIKGFQLTLEDPHATPIARKGQGVQSAALFACFLWISQQELAQGVTPLWLIEEPESYLHPELAEAVQQMLAELGELTQVAVTTHSLAFVPQDMERVVGTELDEDGSTRLTRFKSHREATERIRNSLGIKFSDYYNLGTCNVFCEGPSDVRLFQWFFDYVDPSGEAEWPLIRSAYFEDFGGVRQLEGFLRGAYALIRPERALVAVFDGDQAGQKARQDLQRFFGQKDIPFTSGEDFVTVRSQFAIEGLFPDRFLVDLYENHPSWFTSFSQDAFGEVEPFRIEDRHKRRTIDALIALAEDEDDLGWAERWIAVCNAIEGALERRMAALGA